MTDKKTEPAKESQPHPEDVKEVEKAILEITDAHITINSSVLSSGRIIIKGRQEAAKYLAIWMTNFWSAMDEGAQQWESDCKDAQREVERLKSQLAVKESKPDVELIKKINLYTKGMQEYYMQHNYRQMWGLWQKFVESVSEPNPESPKESQAKRFTPIAQFFVAQCEKCGFKGTSDEWKGGGQIADTGDYGDFYCPVCGQVDVPEADDDLYVDQRDIFLREIDKLHETISELQCQIMYPSPPAPHPEPSEQSQGAFLEWLDEEKEFCEPRAKGEESQNGASGNYWTGQINRLRQTREKYLSLHAQPKGEVETEGWNDADKVLPKHTDFVLGWHREMATYCLCFYNYGQWNLSSNLHYASEREAKVLTCPGKISHWRELPKRVNQ